MTYYKRNLPHWQPEGAQYFITFRLYGSLPVDAIKKLKIYKIQFDSTAQQNFKSQIQKRIFQKYEELLDGTETGPTWLKEKKVAMIVQDSLHFYNNNKYDLFASCIMPNHVHLVFKILDIESNQDSHSYQLADVLHSIKSYTALECNKILNRKGPFWQPESFDRVIRDDEELGNTMAYTLNNPVKAGLVSHWKEWPYTYCKPEFEESFM